MMYTSDSSCLVKVDRFGKKEGTMRLIFSSQQTDLSPGQRFVEALYLLVQPQQPLYVIHLSPHALPKILDAELFLLVVLVT